MRIGRAEFVRRCSRDLQDADGDNDDDISMSVAGSGGVYKCR